MARAGAGLEAGAKSFLWVHHVGVQGTKPLAHLLLLPRHTGRELNHKQSSDCMRH